MSRSHGDAVRARLLELVRSGRTDYLPYLSGEAPIAIGGCGPNPDLLTNAESCPHRVPMPPERETPCGCRWLCRAGKGPRRRKGGVTLTDCWNCEIAPRRAPPRAAESP